MGVEAKVSLSSEKYLTARIVAKCLERYGDRGKLLLGAYAYLRWVDDYADESTDGKEDKLKFLDRQMVIVSGNEKSLELDPVELMFQNLPWSSINKAEGLARNQIQIVLGSIEDDVCHQGLEPRNVRELRHYNIRSLYPCINLTNIVLNGRELRPTKKFMDLMSVWNGIGGIIDLNEDLTSGIIQLPLNFDEVSQIRSFKGLENRKGAFLEIYDKRRLANQISHSIGEVFKSGTGFLDVDMPAWQRYLVTTYILTRVPTKTLFHGLRSLSALAK